MQCFVLVDQARAHKKDDRGHVGVIGDYYRCYIGESNGKENGK